MLSTFAQPGALDPSFADKGKFILPDNQYPVTIGSANAAVIDTDGKIVMISSGIDFSNYNWTGDIAVIRLNKDGTMDNSFGTDGKVLIDFSTPEVSGVDAGYALALQSDGKIVITGYSNDYYHNNTNNTENFFDIAVARLNTDGSLDNSFDEDGKKLIDLSALTGNGIDLSYSYDYGYGVVITPDNKICIMGDTYVADGINTPGYDAYVLKLNNDGSFDNNFDGDGIKIVSQPDSDEYVFGFAMQADDKFIIGGITGGAFNNYTADILVLRLNTDGTPDNNFDGDGRAVIDLGGTNDYGSTVITQTDGKILVNAGQSDAYNSFFNFVVARLNTDGSLDNSFDGDGVQIYGQPNEYCTPNLGLSLQADGKIIQAGSVVNNGSYSSFTGGNNFMVIRYNSDGSVDNSFGNHGRSVIDFGNWTDNFYDVGSNCVIQADGKIIAVGFTSGLIDNNYYNGASATRLLVDGASVSISGPPDQTIQAADGECSVAPNNIDPILDPLNATATVNYELYGSTKGTGTGTLSGHQFNTGTTTAVYSLADNPLNRAVFSVTVNGGNNSIGGALDFDGVDDRVNLGDFYNYTGQYSFEAWIKPRAYTNDDGFGSWIFGDERNFNGGIQVQLDTSGYITTFSPSIGFVKSSYQVLLDTWTHIAFVQTYSELKLYVNGNFVETLLTTPNLQNTGLFETFTLGAFTSDFVNYTRAFNGEMDEVRFWNRPLCQAQIQNNLHCEIPGYADGLVAYYKMNQGIAGCNNLETTFLNNETGAPGTLENFALTGSSSNWVAGYITGSCAPFSPISIACPDPITIELEPGQCSAIVNFNATVIPGCSPNVTVSYSQDPGTYFNAGTTYVYVYASDDQGNFANCSFAVTVTEHEPPVLITKNISLPLSTFGDAFISQYDVVESLTDNCGIDPWNVFLFPTYFNCSNIGDNIITITAMDHSGNTTTQYATVTITPLVTTSTVEVVPSPVQYSDLVTFKATIPNGYWYITCLNSPEVTFKLGDQVLGTVPLGPDYYGNYFDLAGTLDKQILPSDLGTSSRNVTAVFGGTSNGSIVYDKEAFAKLVLKKEDAGIEYTASQFLTTPCSTCINASVPFTAIITDTADFYRGDIHNASATVTITPVTAGASVIGDNTITIPALTLVNSKNTVALLKGKFNVSIGSNKKARFDVSIQAGNYYTGKLKVPVFVTRGNSTAINEFSSAPPDTKAITGKNFDVTVMPNPTHDQFTLKIQSSDLYQKINLRIMDVAGRVIETKQDINKNETVQLGHAYKAGTYMVEITQGQNHKLIRLVKL